MHRFKANCSNPATGRLTGTVTAYPDGWSFPGLSLVASEGTERVGTSGTFTVTVMPPLTVSAQETELEATHLETIYLEAPIVTGQIGSLAWEVVTISGNASNISFEPSGAMSFRANSEWTFRIKATDSADDAVAVSEPIHVAFAYPTTLNPGDKTSYAKVEGNSISSTNGFYWASARAYGGKSSGKWYFEAYAGSVDNAVGLATGTAVMEDGRAHGIAPGQQAGAIGVVASEGWVLKDGTNILTSDSLKWHKQRLMIAYDADAKRMYIGVNGTWIVGDPSTGTGGIEFDPGAPVYPIAGSYRTVPVSVYFAPDALAYGAPPGYRVWTR